VFHALRLRRVSDARHARARGVVLAAI
jgi:hypothetical protein